MSDLGKQENPEMLNRIAGYMADDFEYDESIVLGILEQSHNAPEASTLRLENNIGVLKQLLPKNEEDFSEKVQSARTKARELINNSPKFQEYKEKYGFKYLLGGSLSYGHPEKWDIDLVVVVGKVPQDIDMFDIENELRDSIMPGWNEFLSEQKISTPRKYTHIDISSVVISEVEETVKRSENLDDDNFFEIIDEFFKDFEIISGTNLLNETGVEELKERFMHQVRQSPILRGILIAQIEDYILKIRGRKSKEG